MRNTCLIGDALPRHDNRRRVGEDQPVKKPAAEWTSGTASFLSATKRTYRTEPDKPFLWIRGRQVGGRSIIWGRQSYRWSDLDFEANLREGVGVDWPIRYQEIAPWYDYVESFIRVSGRAEGCRSSGRKISAPMEWNCAELVVKDAVARYFPERRLEQFGRTANLTERHNGRAPWIAPCRVPVDASRVLISAALTPRFPAALTTGK